MLVHLSDVGDVDVRAENAHQLVFVVFDAALHDVHTRAEQSFKRLDVQNCTEPTTTKRKKYLNGRETRYICWHPIKINSERNKKIIMKMKNLRVRRSKRRRRAGDV